jgi:anaerobic selenocysteine-containing dehydrogenase
MESRRDALKIMLATAAAAAGGAAATAVDASVTEKTPARSLAARPAATGPAPWTLLRPLQLGDLLGGTWRLASVGGVVAGAVVIELHDLEGQQARVHVCARKGAAAGLASTPRLDVVLMNGGDGQTASAEYLGRVVLGLAALMEQNEARAFEAHPELADLLTHAERIAAYQGSPALS